MKKSTIIFDLDGTLTNPREGLVRCYRHALESLSLEAPGDELLAAHIGPPIRDVFSSLIDTDCPTRVEAAVSAFRKRFESLGWKENEPYEGVRELLAELNRLGVACYVVTSKPKIFAERILHHFGLADYFYGIYGPELNGHLDNKCELLAFLVEQEQLAPDLTLMVGDRRFDMEAASLLGIDGLGVLYGFGSKEELEQAGAKWFCSSPAEILDAI